MPHNLRNRRMYRMANGGPVPPMPAMGGQGIPPELAAMLGGGGGQPPPMGGQPPPMEGGEPPLLEVSQIPPEILQAAEEALQETGQEALTEAVTGAAEEESVRSRDNLESATDFREIMNAVWDEDLPVEDYRSMLAEVVGQEDADRTPDSVLTLVQPTLQLAQLDQGIGALIQEEMADTGIVPGGITDLATKSAVADSMAAETNSLVGAVGAVSGTPPMEDTSGIMAEAPLPMAQDPYA